MQKIRAGKSHCLGAFAAAASMLFSLCSDASTEGAGANPCATMAERIRLRSHGTLRFPRDGLFTTEDHYLTTRDGERVPRSRRDGIEDHLAFSCGILQILGLGVSSDCHEVYAAGRNRWAPSEGGGKIGHGARTDYLPDPAEEMFQGNLDYFRGQLPEPGTRYIIRNPRNGRSIVASFGYEIGPSSSIFLGGLTAEALYYLQDFDRARTPLRIGRAADQSLPFGPVSCN